MTLLAPTTTRRSRPHAAVAECGTPSGFQRHRRRNEVPCDPCRAARFSRLDVDRVPFESALATGVMGARPDLADMTAFGAAHFAGLVMGA